MIDVTTLFILEYTIYFFI